MMRFRFHYKLSIPTHEHQSHAILILLQRVIPHRFTKPILKQHQITLSRLYISRFFTPSLHLSYIKN